MPLERKKNLETFTLERTCPPECSFSASPIHLQGLIPRINKGGRRRDTKHGRGELHPSHACVMCVAADTGTQSGTWRLIRSLFIGGCSILGLPARTTTAMQKDILLFLSFHFSFFFLSSVCHHSGYLADSECADLARCAPKTYLNWTSNSNIL